MIKFNKDLLGWMVAATLGGLLAASGFQGATESSAVVDLQKVIKSSDLYQVQEKQFQAQVKVRTDLLDFIDKNRVIAADEWKTLRELSLKDKPTDQDKADLQKVKDTISANTKKLADIQAKPTKSADDVSIIEDFQRRVQMVQQSAIQMRDEFSREIPVLQDAAAKVVEDQARLSAQAIGKEQGYTIVFDTLAAPYGAHDITNDTLTRMNKK